MPAFVDSEIGFQHDLNGVRRMHERLLATKRTDRAREYLDMALVTCTFMLQLMDAALASDDPSTATVIAKKIDFLQQQLGMKMNTVLENGGVPPSISTRSKTA